MRSNAAMFVVVALAIPSVAGAGGLAIPGAGPQAQARAGAFVAKADDPTALGHNPAGLMSHSGTVVLLGVNLVDFDLTYTRTGRYEASGAATPPDYEGQSYPAISDLSKPAVGVGGFQGIPTIAIVTDLGQSKRPLRLAVGLFAPQGYPSRRFAETVDAGTTDPAPGPQRFDIMEQEARTVLPSIGIAYRPLPKLDVGVRLSWGFGSIVGKKAVWSIENYEEYPGNEAIFTVEAKDNFIPAYGFGLLYRLSSSVELGAAYQSKLSINAVGTGNSEVSEIGDFDIRTVPPADEYARCKPGGVEGALSACLNIDVPQMVTIGGRYILRDGSGRERGDLELDVRWEQWSATSETSITVDGEVSIDNAGFIPLDTSVNRHGFKDVFSIRLGGSYHVPLGKNRLIIRAGAAHDTKTADVSWNRVDIDSKPRTTLAGGLAFEHEKFRIELGGGVVLEPERTVGQCRPPDGPERTPMGQTGCDGDYVFDPVLERDRPDPAQPLQGPLNQAESPFNAGTYESGYVLLSLGITTWF